MIELYAVAVAAAESDEPAGRSAIGPGSLGFWIVIGLIVVLFLLYRSMRKQMRRVDFDPTATTDAERIASHREPEERDASEGATADGATSERPTGDREPHDHRS
jgi:hypothetical protein